MATILKKYVALFLFVSVSFVVYSQQPDYV